MAILDFTKAFDKVPNKRLIHKLNYYGITGSIATWVETFLTGGTQQVVVNGATSSSNIVTSGVPQGTVIGPLLFLLYINDLPDNLSTSVRLFADDCILYTPIRTQNDSSLLQNDLHKLQKWQDTWLMKFNPERGSSVGRMPDSQSREPGFESPLLPFRSLGIFFHFTTPQSTQLYK